MTTSLTIVRNCLELAKHSVPIVRPWGRGDYFPNLNALAQGLALLVSISMDSRCDLLSYEPASWLISGRWLRRFACRAFMRHCAYVCTSEMIAMLPPHVLRYSLACE